MFQGTWAEATIGKLHHIMYMCSREHGLKPPQANCIIYTIYTYIHILNML